MKAPNSKSRQETGENIFLKIMGNKWTAISVIFIILGFGFKAGCVYEENKKNIEHLRLEKEEDEKQERELFELRVAILNLTADLRDCESERKQNEGAGAKNTKGDK